MHVTDDSKGGASVTSVSLSNLNVPPTANAGEAATYEHLLQRVWSANSNGDVRSMLIVVSTHRRNLGDNADTPPKSHRASRRLSDAEGRDDGTGTTPPLLSRR